MAASNARHLISAVVALAAAKRRTVSVGVCWTRNEVPQYKEQACRHGHVPDHLAPWAPLRASAITLKTFHPTVKTCLFTDASEEIVRDAMAALHRCGFHKDPGALDLFDEIIAQEPFEAHFGVGSAVSVDVRIDWPDGRSVVLEDVATGQTLTVTAP